MLRNRINRARMKMKKIVLPFALCFMAAAIFTSPSFAQETSYDQPWRPQYHFTPPQNFMNDPNGTVYYQGEYHLFYQYNPEGNVWGHMHWGHAVSRDMVHWQNLPIALREEPGKYMAFSGSAVVDRENSSGLCRNPDPSDHSCLIAIYTADSKGHERQNLAFSNDRGRTWTNYPGNPVADLGVRDFRDPNVFWYEPQHKWVMIAVLANEKSVVILDSPDLKNWTRRSTFGPAGETTGVWECPDLFELAVEGTKEKKWVLIVSRSTGAPFGGTDVRYIVGKFDGTTFTSEVPDSPELWADWGKDFYAANTWNDAPVSPGQRVWIGWFSNWQYANAEPSVLWRGAQTIPRTLSLRRYSDGLHLVQKPVTQLESLRGEMFHVANASVAKANQKSIKMESRVMPTNWKLSFERDEPGKSASGCERAIMPRRSWASILPRARSGLIEPARAKSHSAKISPGATPRSLRRMAPLNFTYSSTVQALRSLRTMVSVYCPTGFSLLRAVTASKSMKRAPAEKSFRLPSGN